MTSQSREKNLPTKTWESQFSWAWKARSTQLSRRPLVKREVIRDTDNMQCIEPYWPGTISMPSFCCKIQQSSYPTEEHLSSSDPPFPEWTRISLWRFSNRSCHTHKFLVLLQPKSWKVSPGYNIIFVLNQHISRYLKMPSGFGEQLRLKGPNFWQHWQQYFCSFREREERWLPMQAANISIHSLCPGRTELSCLKGIYISIDQVLSSAL